MTAINIARATTAALTAGFAYKSYENGRANKKWAAAYALTSATTLVATMVLSQKAEFNTSKFIANGASKLWTGGTNLVNCGAKHITVQYDKVADWARKMLKPKAPAAE